MKRLTTLTVASVMALSSFSFAAFGESHAMKEEAMMYEMGEEGIEALMKANGAATKVLGDMAKGTTAYDATAAEEAKMALIANAKEIPHVFEQPIEGGETLPAAWENWEDFVAKATAMEEAAMALDVSSAESIGAGLGMVGGTCGGCHQLYRVKS